MTFSEVAAGAMRTRGLTGALARVEELKFVSIDTMPPARDILALFGYPRLWVEEAERLTSRQD